MSYEIENISPIEKQITVQIPMEEVDIAIEAIISNKRKTFEKKGFRKDKIPDSLIFKEQKEEILDHATRQIFDIHVKKARKLYGIVPLDRVRITSEKPLAKGEKFTFRFIAEVLPDLDLPDFSDTEIEVKKVVVTETDIDRIIDSLREQLSTLDLITEKRNPVDGDVAEFDFESLGEFKSTMGMSGTGHKLEMGTDDTIKDFEAIIKSLKPGESKTGLVSYPDEFPNPTLAGKQVETHISLKNLYQKILPDVDEAFAKQVTRVETVTEMREIMRRRHNHKLSILHQQDAQRRLLDKLMQSMEIPLSTGYVEQNLKEMISSYTMAMQQRGVSAEEISGDVKEKYEQFQPEAEIAARRQLFLLAIAKKQQLKLEPHEMEAEITQQAKAANTDPSQFMLKAQQSGMIRQIKDGLMMQKVMNFLYENANKKMVDKIQD